MLEKENRIAAFSSHFVTGRRQRSRRCLDEIIACKGELSSASPTSFLFTNIFRRTRNSAGRVSHFVLFQASEDKRQLKRQRETVSFGGCEGDTSLITSGRALQCTRQKPPAPRQGCKKPRIFATSGCWLSFPMLPSRNSVLVWHL